MESARLLQVITARLPDLPDEMADPSARHSRVRPEVERVVDTVLERAVRGLLLPGDHLPEADLARDLGTSRSVAGAALRRLEDQGIVVDDGDHGARLVFFGSRRLRKILKVRFALERLAAVEIRAAASEGDDVYRPLTEVIDRMWTAAKADDRYALACADQQFHRTLCELSGNETLVRAWEQLACAVLIVFGLSTLYRPLGPVAADHEDLLRVVREGSAADLDRMMYLHLFDTVLSCDLAAIVARRREQRLHPPGQDAGRGYPAAGVA